MIKSLNPYNQEEIGNFEETSIPDLDRKLYEAQKGFATWRYTGFEERAGYLRALADLLRKNTDEVATLISREMGKVIGDSRKEVNKSAMALDYFAEHGKEYLDDQVKKTDKGEGIIAYQPLGVVLGIMPWNYPFWLFFRFASTTLMAGNTILLKHSSDVPACAQKIDKIFQEACVPGGVFQNLVVRPDKIENIVKDFRVQAASLTGSVEAGSELARHAGKNIKKVVLELGGSDPFIVLEDADVKKAAESGARSRMKNFGQSCDAAKRFILHKNIADEFLEAFRETMDQMKFGDPMDEESDYACMSSPGQKNLLRSQVRDSVDQGAEVFWKGNQAPENDAFFNPMILTGVRQGMPAYREELFGPVASVMVASDGVEAVRIANDSDYGLGASIWTGDLERGWKMSREVQAGIIYINDEVHSRPELPFGGVKKSGIGREMAVAGSREFTNRKSIWYDVNKE
ncbi:MAG: NAD-dependent succinate-semialdehyde dehydrogenase [Bacteroidales bacterium]